MDTLPEFNEVGECERCKLERPVSKTGICEECFRKILELRDGKHGLERQKRLRALDAAENAILRNVRTRMLMDSHQTPPQRGLSFPKMLKERDARKTQKIHAKAALQELVRHARDSSTKAEVLVQAVVEPSLKSNEGDLVRAIISPWRAIVELLKDDWNQAYQISPRTWEELIAGAFDQDGYDEVILTPRSGDFGRDVVATKHGVGSVRIIDSVKAFRPDRLVRQDDVRALLGVLYGDPRASKAIITTTSDFAPGIASDPYLAPSMPTRLELMNGVQLRDWMTKLSDA